MRAGRFWWLGLAGLVASGLVVGHHAWRFSTDMLRGDGSAEQVRPAPLYGFMRVPAGPIAAAHQAEHRLAMDFAQVYFPSQDLTALDRNYVHGALDPWGRASRYAPFVHYACALTLCRLDYGLASVLHMLIQTGLFAGCLVMAFGMLGIGGARPLGLSVAALLLFASPTGLAWLERGQFSLYVATSHLLLLLGLLKNRVSLVAWSGVLAYVKWTAFPFALVAVVVFLLRARTPPERHRALVLLAVFVLPLALFSLASPLQSVHFLHGLIRQERFASPEGVSLALVLPRTVVKSLPLVLVALGYLHARQARWAFERLAPFLMGAGILLLTYPSVAFEYNLPAAFCFIPLACAWLRRRDPAGGRLDRLPGWLLLGFLVVASYASSLNPSPEAEPILAGYLLGALALLLLPLITSRRLGAACSRSS